MHADEARNNGDGNGDGHGDGGEPDLRGSDEGDVTQLPEQQEVSTNFLDFRLFCE